METKVSNQTVSLYKLQIEGSKERKSLSGALKCSKATSVNFWKAIAKKIKSSEVDPAWIVKNASEKQLHRTKKTGEVEKRENWSAFLVETIVRKKFEQM